MKVTLYDVDQPDRPINGQYTIDTTLGAPAVGDDVFLRASSGRRAYLSATVRRRCWMLADDAPALAELHVWVQRHGKPE